MLEKLLFPKDFLWGTSISTTQTEGNSSNDWKDVVAEDGSKVGLACDHYNRYEEDFALAAGMNNNCIRLGLEWSRLQKTPYGELDRNEVRHYKEYLQEAINRGLKPMVVLHHFANPVWFVGRGGWLKDDSVGVFSDYAKKAVREFSDIIDLWNVFNEPSMHLLNSYLAGFLPKLTSSPLVPETIRNNMANANETVYKFAKGLGDNTMATTFAWRPCWGSTLMDDIIAKVVSYFINDRYTKRFMDHSDFFGLSYYGDVFIKDKKAIIPALGTKKSDVSKLGMKCDDLNLLTPERLIQTLEDIANKYRKPIIITENGFATTDEGLREEMLVCHIQETAKAIGRGIDIRGYIHWSLLDNFEWTFGYSKKFGLHEVNFKTQDRTKRPAADAYAKICKDNSINI